MIGLWQAIVDYRHDKATSFPTFAKKSASIATLSPLPRPPLARSSSAARYLLPGGSCRITSHRNGTWRTFCKPWDEWTPRRSCSSAEDSRRLHSLLHQMLSDSSGKVLSGYQMGKSYREIARELRCKTKSVDNALMRIKRKVSSVSVEDFEWVVAD